MLNLTASEIYEIWTKGVDERIRKEICLDYYNGSALAPFEKNHTITYSLWVRKIVNFHTSFLVGQPVSYSTDDDNKKPINDYIKLMKQNSAPLVDENNTQRALLYGNSVEVITNNNGNICFSSYDPRAWQLIYDGHLVGAIRHVEIPQNTFYDGVLNREKRDFFYVYDDTFISKYEYLKNGLKLVSQYQHFIGRIPIIDYTYGNHYLITNALLTNIDLWCILISLMTDDVKNVVDSMLLLKNVAIERWMQKDDDGQTLFQKYQLNKILPLDGEADASFLQRVIDTGKFEFSIDLIRKNIFEMGSMPDLGSKIQPQGTIGSQTLQLFYNDAIVAATSFKRYLEDGLRERVKIINNIYSLYSKPTIEDINIDVTINTPNDDILVAQYLSSLESTFSVKDRQALFGFNKNKDQTYQNYLDEKRVIKTTKE